MTMKYYANLQKLPKGVHYWPDWSADFSYAQISRAGGLRCLRDAADDGLSQ